MSRLPLFLMFAAFVASADPAAGQLQKVASFHGAQVTGITRSESGRLFASFPRWRDDLPYSVVEIRPDGTYRPYPDRAWNTWNGAARKGHFTCVQSVVAHGDSLYILDPSSPKALGVVGRATLYEFDLKTDRLKHEWAFDASVAPEMSYLNDLRIDSKSGHIYLTDSGLGAIVVLDPATGVARRLLDDHPSTLSENVVLTVEAKPVLIADRPAQFHSDGIALSEGDGYLYYHALTAYTLYRVPLAVLANPELDNAAVAAAVENLGKTPAPDGMIFDDRGNLYMADLENNAIVYRTPNGDLRTLVQDERIKWADSFTIDKTRGLLIFTVSRIHDAPIGAPAAGLEFPVYQIKLANE